MSTAASPNPNNMLMLVVIGVGAYYLLTRRAMAQPVQRPQQQGSSAGGIASIVAQALGAAMGAGKPSTPYPYYGTYDGRSAQPWDVTPQGPSGPRYNNPSAYVAGGNDGLAYNPPGVDPWEATNYMG